MLETESRKIAIFGAGIGGMQTYNILCQYMFKEKVVAFCDNSVRSRERDIKDFQ